MSSSKRGFSKNQIRKLGSRLRNSDVPSQEDASAYILWSQGFGPALSEVEAKIRNVAEREPLSGNFQISARIKQISSVRAKLVRQRTSLSDLEDIAGCRIILPSSSDVERIILQCARLPITRARDYREHSNNGYRAVHFTVRSDDGHAVELQVRTRIEHAWAQLAERAAAMAGMEVKYGGGPKDVRELLDNFSTTVRFMDVARQSLALTPIFEQMLLESGEPDSYEERRRAWHDVEALLSKHEEEMIAHWATLFAEDRM